MTAFEPGHHRRVDERPVEKRLHPTGFDPVRRHRDQPPVLEAGEDRGIRADDRADVADESLQAEPVDRGGVRQPRELEQRTEAPGQCPFLDETGLDRLEEPRILEGRSDQGGGLEQDRLRRRACDRQAPAEGEHAQEATGDSQADDDELMDALGHHRRPDILAERRGRDVGADERFGRLESRRERPAELAVGQDHLDRLCLQAALRGGFVGVVHRRDQARVRAGGPAEDFERRRRDVGLGPGPVCGDDERPERCHLGLDSGGCGDVAVDDQHAAPSPRRVAEQGRDRVDDHLAAGAPSLAR